MNEVNTLDAPAIIESVETYLTRQYERRQQAQRVERTTERVEGPADGVVVILAWCLIGWILIGGK